MGLQSLGYQYYIVHVQFPRQWNYIYLEWMNGVRCWVEVSNELWLCVQVEAEDLEEDNGTVEEEFDGECP